MSVREVLVKFRADVGGFTTPVDRAKVSVEALHESTKNTQAWKALSTGALAAGAAVTVGLGFAVKAAADWETAWAGVLKTVDATPEQFAALEDELKQLARELPVSAQEIAAVAENAGQLGIKAQDIARFTRTMVGLGEATNLTSDEAATMVAQIANIMGTTGDGIDRFGATLVALGNNGASTEKDILALAQRIAASGKLIGLSETDILAYASALSSVGVEAEAGGTALSMTFSQIRADVDKGGQALETIAKTAGMTSDQFRAAFKDNAGAAVAAFVTGLGEVEKTGGSATAVLNALGMSGIRQRDALLSLSASGSLLTDSLRLSGQAWSANNALAAETARRYSTTASKIQLAANSANQAAAEIGANLLPVLAGAAQGAAAVTNAWADMPGPLQASIAGVTGFVGIGLLAVGGTMKLASGLAELKGNLTTVSGLFPKLSSKMAGVPWAGIAAGAAGAAVALTALSIIMTAVNDNADNVLISAEGVASGLAAVGKAGVGLAPVNLQLDKMNETINASARWDFGDRIKPGTVVDLATALTTAATAADVFASGPANSMDGWLGIRTTTGIVTKEVQKLDQGLADLATGGNVQQAQSAFDAMATKWEAAGNTGRDKLLPAFPALSAALSGTAAQIGITNLTAAELAGWMGGTIPEGVKTAAAAHPELVANLTDAERAMLNEATASDKVATALRAQVEQTRAVARAQIEASGSRVAFNQVLADTEKALTKVVKSTNKARTELNLHTKAGRDNQTLLNTLATNTLNTADAMDKVGASSAEVANTVAVGRSAFVDAAIQMGLTRTAAEEMADAYTLIPGDVATRVTLPGGKTAKVEAKEIRDRLNALPIEKRPRILAIYQSKGVDAAKAALNKLDHTTAKPKVDVQWTGLAKTITVHYKFPKGVDTVKKAGGGWVDGPGSWTSDSILTALSRDEFVVRAQRATALERTHPGLLNYLNGNDPLPGFAGGGSLNASGYAPAQQFYNTNSNSAVSTGASLTIGNLVWRAETAEENRVLEEFISMANRKAAAGIGGQRRG